MCDIRSIGIAIEIIVMETSATATAQVPRRPNWSKTEITHMIVIWSDVDVQAAIDDPLTKNVKV